MNVKTHTAKPEAFYPGNDFFMDEEVPKIAWQIGEVANMLAIKNSTVRHYSLALGLKAMRSDKGNLKPFTLYRREDINKLKRLKSLVDFGFSVKGAAPHVDHADKILKSVL